MGEIDIVPLIADSTGVDLNSGFKIVSENKISSSLIQKAMTISPIQEYKIEQISDKELHISFSEPLNLIDIQICLTSRAPGNASSMASNISGSIASNIASNTSSSMTLGKGTLSNGYSADSASTGESSISPSIIHGHFKQKSFTLTRTLLGMVLLMFL